jgi:hypothetical protein
MEEESEKDIELWRILLGGTWAKSEKPGKSQKIKSREF